MTNKSNDYTESAPADARKKHKPCAANEALTERDAGATREAATAAKPPAVPGRNAERKAPDATKGKKDATARKSDSAKVCDREHPRTANEPPLVKVEGKVTRETTDAKEPPLTPDAKSIVERRASSVREGVTNATAGGSALTTKRDAPLPDSVNALAPMRVGEAAQPTGDERTDSAGEETTRVTAKALVSFCSEDMLTATVLVAGELKTAHLDSCASHCFVSSAMSSQLTARGFPRVKSPVCFEVTQGKPLCDTNQVHLLPLTMIREDGTQCTWESCMFLVADAGAPIILCYTLLRLGGIIAYEPPAGYEQVLGHCMLDNSTPHGNDMKQQTKQNKHIEQ